MDIHFIKANFQLLLCVCMGTQAKRQDLQWQSERADISAKSEDIWGTQTVTNI